ncbi:MAG: prepilin-type N-terminal cleavage/methylation domain-containing protein [Saccharospirillaceae bacterium]|nr:prepilin-type N-terminal cleavage/methylation domain-containing protein [Saccharospirillaceae bacterium]
MKSVQKGFTLIELMIVIAIIGILASVALPAYQNYISKAKGSAALASLNGSKLSAEEDYAVNGNPRNTDLTMTEGDVVVVLSPDYVSVPRAIIWACSTTGVGFKSCPNDQDPTLIALTNAVAVADARLAAIIRDEDPDNNGLTFGLEATRQAAEDTAQGIADLAAQALNDA